MSRWLDPVRAPLRDREPRVRWFFRDDDAGWDDPRLLALVDVVRDGGGRVDLAAIPAAVSPALGRRLSRLVGDGGIAVHQHGWAHVNHEPEGRKCEFGPARTRNRQLQDLRRGRRLLLERLEGRVEPFFTPPWNRCSATTAELLPGVGISALSTDLSAPRRDVPGLAEIRVAVDWTRAWSRGGRASLAGELRGALLWASEEATAPAVGVMLHHAAMNADELSALRDLLVLLDEAPAAEIVSIGAVLDERTLMPVSRPGHAGARA